MRNKKKIFSGLVVTEQAIKDFSVLSARERLQWLDEMRSFLIKTLPKRTLRNWKPH